MVDQAVKSLSEIWHPQDIPVVFVTTEKSPAMLKLTPNLVPLKGFVHEVLRWSRSGMVLQTALCYVEAIRQKVPELVRKEKAGEGVSGENDAEERLALGG
jgi:PHO85 cyclin-5